MEMEKILEIDLCQRSRKCVITNYGKKYNK